MCACARVCVCVFVLWVWVHKGGGGREKQREGEGVSVSLAWAFQHGLAVHKVCMVTINKRQQVHCNLFYVGTFHCCVRVSAQSFCFLVFSTSFATLHGSSIHRWAGVIRWGQSWTHSSRSVLGSSLLWHIFFLHRWPERGRHTDTKKRETL